MKYFILLICFIGLSGCMSTDVPLAQTTQRKFIGQPISNVVTRLGSPDKTYLSSSMQYSWTIKDTRWTTVAYSQKMTGTRFVNGHNVATIVNGPPIRNLQSVSCQLVVITNKENLVLSMSQISSGMDCGKLISKLNNDRPTPPDLIDLIMLKLIKLIL